MVGQIKKEEGFNSIKSELDNKTEVDRNLSVVNNPAKRQYVKDEDIKDDSIPKRQKTEQNGDKFDIKQENVEDAKNTNQAGSSNKREKISEIKLEDPAKVDINSEDTPKLTPSCKDGDKMVDAKFEDLPDLPKEGNPYVRKRDEIGIKVEDLQNTIVRSIVKARHLGIKAEDTPVFKVEFSEDIYDDSTRGNRAEFYTTPDSDPIYHRIRWHRPTTPDRIIASLSRSPLSLSSPAESPTPSGERPSTQPTPNFSTLSSPEPDPDSSEESNSSDSDSDGYEADISENSSSWDSDSDDPGYSPDSNFSDSDTPPPSTGSSLSRGESSSTDATSPAPAPNPTPYVSLFTAPLLFYRDFYPTPVVRRPGAASPNIRFYRKNFFDRPAMVPASRS